MRILLISIVSAFLLMLPSWAQSDDDKQAFWAVEDFYKYASGYQYEKAMPQAGLVWPTDPEQLEVLRSFGFTSSISTDEDVRACEQNLKNYATALEMYATDYGGRYPKDSGLLTPNYLRSLPTCPTSETVAYSFSSTADPDYYRVACVGDNHEKGSKSSFVYDSENGLGKEAEAWIVYLSDVKTDGDDGSIRVVRGYPQGTILRPIADTTLKLKKTDGNWHIDPSPLVEPVKKSLSAPPKSGWSGVLPVHRDLGILMGVLFAWEDPEMMKLVNTHLCRYRMALVAKEIEDYRDQHKRAPKSSELEIGTCPVSGKTHGYEVVNAGPRIWCEDSPHGEKLEFNTAGFEEF